VDVCSISAHTLFPRNYSSQHHLLRTEPLPPPIYALNQSSQVKDQEILYPSPSSLAAMGHTVTPPTTPKLYVPPDVLNIWLRPRYNYPNNDGRFNYKYRLFASEEYQLDLIMIRQSLGLHRESKPGGLDIAGSMCNFPMPCISSTFSSYPGYPPSPSIQHVFYPLAHAHIP
jgi:hypothetical protein